MMCTSQLLGRGNFILYMYFLAKFFLCSHHSPSTSNFDFNYSGYCLSVYIYERRTCSRPLFVLLLRPMSKVKAPRAYVLGACYVHGRSIRHNNPCHPISFWGRLDFQGTALACFCRVERGSSSAKDDWSCARSLETNIILKPFSMYYKPFYPMLGLLICGYSSVWIVYNLWRVMNWFPRIMYVVFALFPILMIPWAHWHCSLFVHLGPLMPRPIIFRGFVIVLHHMGFL